MHNSLTSFSSRLVPSKALHLNSRAKATRSLFSSVPSLTWASSNLTPAKLSTSLVTCPNTPYTSLRLGELAATLGLSPHESFVYLRRSLDLEVGHSTVHSARTRACSSVRDTDPLDRGTVQVLSRVRFAWFWSRVATSEACLSPGCFLSSSSSISTSFAKLRTTSRDVLAVDSESG